jgi:hypothetical protein
MPPTNDISYFAETAARQVNGLSQLIGKNGVGKSSCN